MVDNKRNSGRKIEIKIEMDLDSFNLVSSIDNPSEVDKVQSNIHRAIVKSIKDEFLSKADTLVDEVNALIDEESYSDAYEYLFGNGLIFSKVEDVRILDSISLLLEKESNIYRKTDLLAVKLHFMFMFELYEQVPDVVDDILNRFNDEFDRDFIINVNLEKAEAYRLQGMDNIALAIYREAISNTSDPEIKGYCYHSISKLTKENKERNLELASDYYSISGNSKQRIRCLRDLSEYHFGINFQDSLVSLNKALEVYVSTTETLEREYYAELLHKKSLLLLTMRDFKSAIEPISQACQLRKGVVGVEGKYYVTLKLAQDISYHLKDYKKSEEYKREAEEVFEFVDDKNIMLQEEVFTFITTKQTPNKEMESKVMQSKNPYLCKNYLIYCSQILDGNYHQKLIVLDKALSIESEGEVDDLIYNAIADVYLDNEKYDEALQAFKKSLEINPYNIQVYQQCCYFLKINEGWSDIRELLLPAENRIGFRPNINYVLAEAMFNLGQFEQALKRFVQLKGLSDVSPDKINDYIGRCISSLGPEEVSQAFKEQKEIVREISLSEFENAISEFSKSIASDSRMSFWKRDKESGSYKWINSPEEHSKQLFIAFMNGKFGRGSIELIQEPRAGAGFIDLYVILSGGLKVVVELKMCGERYSSTYAKSGCDQILHYLDNKETKVGYLIVFDSRKKDYATGFKRKVLIDNYNIITEVVDVRYSVRN